MAPATDTHDVVLVAFGSLSDPEPHQRGLEELAVRVGDMLPGWRVRGATLGHDGAVARAFEGLGPDAVVFPALMSDGFILRKVMRDALVAAGRGDAPVLRPLGLLPAFHEVCADMIRDALTNNRLQATRTTVVLAAHGSARGPRPAACARMLCGELERMTRVKAVTPGYLEEAPFLKDALAAAPSPSICLPCFVVSAFHASSDVPEAVDESGFTGPVLPVAGSMPGVAEVIAQEIQSTRQRGAA
ncbi:sirohydrochlorin chelatase [Palleronia caenipelagi]|nr:CbiX/SirB N-terminal domain-containing protein [Palleronia caenipelagi]